MKKVLKYDSNNSGGTWWLSEKDWDALAEAGWTVHWGKRNYNDDPLTHDIPKNQAKPRLGALAMSAAKAFETAQEGVAEWENLTGQNAEDLGCGCCGPPHSFEFDNVHLELYSPHTGVLQY